MAGFSRAYTRATARSKEYLENVEASKKDIVFQHVQIGNFDGEWVFCKTIVEKSTTEEGKKQQQEKKKLLDPLVGGGCALLYLHGGGYMVGSAHTHRLATVPMAIRGINYRLAPRFPFPAAVDDAMDALHYLQGHFEPSKVAVMGDSAGGGLSFSLCIRASQLGVPGPAALCVLAPWTDLTITGHSIQSNSPYDKMFSPFTAYMNDSACLRYTPWLPMLNKMQEKIIYREFKQAARAYARDRCSDPLASPLLASTEVLGESIPPSYIATSKSEVLLDDSVRMEKKLEEAGVEVEAEYFENELHVFALFDHSKGSNGAHVFDACAKHIQNTLLEASRQSSVKVDRIKKGDTLPKSDSRQLT